MNSVHAHSRRCMSVNRRCEEVCNEHVKTDAAGGDPVVEKDHWPSGIAGLCPPSGSDLTNRAEILHDHVQP